MSKIEQFYDNLYLIAFKSLLIDGISWVKLNSQYAIKAKIDSNVETQVSEVSIMIVNRFGTGVYEHRIIVSKLNEVRGMSALFPIMKRCTTNEKVRYILSEDLTMQPKKYRMVCVPVHIKPINKSLYTSVIYNGEKTLDELIDLLRDNLNNTNNNEKQYTKKN